ncbi:MAG: nuclear transport factor 2 family protein [Ekhidna sp.]|nr:nuclear transport factor 2 family protein [Ekhidna sp.]
MTTQQVADQLVKLCREGKFEECIQNLYSPNIVSIEPEGGPWEPKVQGFDSLRKKALQWREMVQEYHSNSISDPVVAENFFSIAMKSSVTLKGMDERINMDEICLYQVEDGKVITEQFFYTPVPQEV